MWFWMELSSTWAWGRSTYHSHSARRREGAHSAGGLADGVTQHIREVYAILWEKGEPIAEELQLMGEEIWGDGS